MRIERRELDKLPPDRSKRFEGIFAAADTSMRPLFTGKLVITVVVGRAESLAIVREETMNRL